LRDCITLFTADIGHQEIDTLPQWPILSIEGVYYSLNGQSRSLRG
jgi:hypothetical protein